MATRASRVQAVEAAEDRRAEPRLAVAITNASVRRLASQPATAALADISIYGCHLVSTEGLAADERVWLRLGGSMPIAARVVWATGDRCGCRFDVPIARILLRGLVLSLA